jgi:hypothetical protein
MPPPLEEERHLIKVVLVWTGITLVLLAVAIGVLVFGLSMLVSSGGPGG